MRNLNCIKYKLIVFTLLISINVSSQNNDIEKTILKIRKQYGQIVNNEIPGLHEDILDFSVNPTGEESEEEANYGYTNKYEIHHTAKDTFLIKHIYMQDEGGAYFSTTTELYFWNGAPFFYYSESERMWEGTREQHRIYIKNGKVIRRLYKKAQFYTPDKGFIDVSMDTVPNQSMQIKATDYGEVLEFIGKYESAIFEVD